jgi:hypothetical protein
MAEIKLELGKLMLADKWKIVFSSEAGSVGYDLDCTQTAPFDGVILNDDDIRILQDFLEKSKWVNPPGTT